MAREKKIKRLAMRHILLAITFFLCFNAFSQGKVVYNYRKSDSTLIISGKGEVRYLDVNKFGGKCVRVDIKEGIESLQFFSFCGFRLMKEVNFPNSLRIIGKNTFIDCSSLESVVLPPKVRFLAGSFNNCENLKDITFPDTIGIDMGSFRNCKKLKKLSFNYLSCLSNCFFDNCINLESLEVRDCPSYYQKLDGGVLYCHKMWVIYPYGKRDKKYIFPDTIKEMEMSKNPYVEELFVSDEMKKIYLHPCENLKLIRSENKIFYDRRDGELKLDSIVVHLNERYGIPLR